MSLPFPPFAISPKGRENYVHVGVRFYFTLFSVFICLFVFVSGWLVFRILLYRRRGIQGSYCIRLVVRVCG